MKYFYRLKIKTKNGINKVTEDHQILVIRNLSEDISKENIKIGLKNGIYSLEWVSAKELLKTDKLIKY